MSYIVLARKYRPQTFDEVLGQSHIVKILQQSIATNRLAHAFLFAGPRGVGKTSCARILAKALNCHKGLSPHPCGQCPSCVDIVSAKSFDVVEIDGASNRGIDEIRALRENVKFAPSYGRYKIYIVDEVHMLTTEAFNALLKTLEEPPDYVKFIFATTEPHKVLPTIVSRCQRYDFKRASLNTIVEKLEDIVAKEHLRIEPSALAAIAKAATGSLRDALSVLDQLSAVGSDQIKEKDVISMLGLVETSLIFALADGIAAKNCAGCMEILERIADQGKDLKQLLRNIIEHYRHLMIVKVGGQSLCGLVDYPVAIKEMLLEQATHYHLEDILKALDIFVDAQEMAKMMDSFRMAIEVSLARLTLIQGSSQVVSRAGEKGTGQKSSSTSRLANHKGHLDFSPKASSAAADHLPSRGSQGQPSHPDCPQASDASVEVSSQLLTLEDVRRQWDAMTFAISQERMSVATYLQEGQPFQLTGDVLVIAFPEHARFHKEALEDKKSIDLILRTIKVCLKRSLRLEFKIVDAITAHDNEPAIQQTLQQFQGKVIHTWHQAKAS